MNTIKWGRKWLTLTFTDEWLCPLPGSWRFPSGTSKDMCDPSIIDRYGHQNTCETCLVRDEKGIFSTRQRAQQTVESKTLPGLYRWRRLDDWLSNWRCARLDSIDWIWSFVRTEASSSLGIGRAEGAVTVGYPNQVLPKKNMRSVIPIMLTSARKLMGEKGDRASRVCFARQT